MSRDISRRLILGLLALAPTGVLAAPAAPPLSADDQALVDKAVAFLQALSKAKGRFAQTDDHGKTAVGDIYLQRPGKVRFEYDPPNNNFLMVSDGNQVEFLDTKLGSPTIGPLRATPLSLFLSKEIRLDRGVQVTKVERGDGVFTITARDGRGDTAGQIEIVFGADPISLKEWTVTNAQRQRTRIQLTGLKSVASLNPDLFRVDTPRNAFKSH